MAKPVITFRNTKGAALTYTELDTNFQNLKDATLTFSDGANNLVSDLNDTITFLDHPEHNLNILVSDAGSTIEVDNVLSEYTREPAGFENRSDSTISFDKTTRIFTIQPRSPTPEYRVWCHGEMYIKTTANTVTIPNTTGLYRIYFDTSAVLQYKTTDFVFREDTMVAWLQWNASTGDYYLLGDERHGITMDWATHEYLNALRGLAYASGLEASGYTLVGNGSADAHAQIDLADGVMFQEDIKIEITDAPTTPVYEDFEQNLRTPGQFAVIYHSNSTGQWVKDSATNFPVKQGTARIKYNLNTAGVWSTPDASANHYVAYWLVATINIKDGPIMSLMGQREDSNISNAQDNNTWASLDLTNFPGNEVRPLYRLIFQTGSYGNTVNARLVDLADYRTVAISGEGSTVISSPPAFQNVVAGGTTLTADSSAGTLTLTAGGSITITGNSGTDTVTISSSASGTVNAGTAGFFAYYPNSADVVDDIGSLRYNSSSGYLELYSDLNLRGKTIRDSTGNPRINDDLYFTTNTTGPVGSGTLIMRNTASYNTKITLDSSNVYLEGALKVSAITGTPGNTSTPTGYLEVVIGTTTRYIPYYT